MKILNFRKSKLHRCFICGASIYSTTILVTKYEYEYDCLSLSFSTFNIQHSYTQSPDRTQWKQMAKWYVLLLSRHSAICLFLHHFVPFFFLLLFIRNDLIWRGRFGLVNRWLNFMQRLLLLIGFVSFHTQFLHSLLCDLRLNSMCVCVCVFVNAQCTTLTPNGVKVQFFSSRNNRR